MKSAETKSNATAASKPASSFFSGKSDDHFFGAATTESSFFPASSARPAVQAKLTIGEPNDPYEREADAVADQVIRRSSASDGIPFSPGLVTPFIQQKCEKCEEEKKLQRSPLTESRTDGTIQAKAIFSSNEEQETGVQRKCEHCAEEEKLQKKDNNSGAGTAGTAVESSLHSSRGSGSPLPAAIRSEMESGIGADFSGVTIHNDSPAAELSRDLNAQAFTYGSDIYFGEAKYNTSSDSGKRLLAHELTHVVQQNQGVVRRNIIQRDLAKSMPVTQGVFEIDMETENGIRKWPPTTKAGMSGSITFTPDESAPYSNEIKLFQIAKVKDEFGVAADPLSMPAGRGVSLRTSADPAHNIEPGFATDVEHQDFSRGKPYTVADPGSALGAEYPPAHVFGFKRSKDPQDIKAAKLWDGPGAGGGTYDFELETIAKGQDSNAVYGAIHWGFGARNGIVINEKATVEDFESPTADAAMELHRNFYVHEPVVFYFEFGHADLLKTESDKINGFLGYLKHFPDVTMSISGYADERGEADRNSRLSLDRAEKVKATMIAKGIPETSISYYSVGMGATHDFTDGDYAPNPGRGQDLDANRHGNRRVVVAFQHTASYPGL